jgi:hypothetical protein
MKAKTITPEQAEQLEAATLKNIVDKVGAGGIPSAREIEMIRSAIGETENPKPSHFAKNLPKVAPSISNAAAIWGLEKKDIQRAKTGGCTAFKGSRVHRDDLIAWLKANPRSAEELAMDGKNLSLQDQKLAKQIEKLDIEIARSRGDLVERAIVTEEWGKHITRLFDIVTQSCSRDMAMIITKEFRGYLGKAAKDL